MAILKSELNETTTRKVAHLARLKLSEEEVTLFTAQLAQVLNYVDQLQEVEVTGVEPLIHPHERPLVLREDQAEAVPVSSDGGSRVLESAPDLIDHAFKVPQVIG